MQDEETNSLRFSVKKRNFKFQLNIRISLNMLIFTGFAIWTLAVDNIAASIILLLTAALTALIYAYIHNKRYKFHVYEIELHSDKPSIIKYQDHDEEKILEFDSNDLRILLKQDINDSGLVFFLNNKIVIQQNLVLSWNIEKTLNFLILFRRFMKQRLTYDDKHYLNINKFVFDEHNSKYTASP